MRRILSTSFVLLIGISSACARHTPPAPLAPPLAPAPIEVMLLGSFHFNSVNVEKYDVLKDPWQSDVRRIAAAVAAWGPDRVFVELQPEYEQSRLDSVMQQPDSAVYRLRSEVYQLGMRIARLRGLTRVHAVDHPGRYGTLIARVRTAATELSQQATLDGEAPFTWKSLHEMVNEDSLREANTLLAYVRRLNSREWHQRDLSHYLARFGRIGLVPVTEMDSGPRYQAGGDLVADWYRRNAQIYAKMMHWMDFKERRIVLVIGNGHVPVLTQLFEAHGGFRVVDPLTVLPRR